MIETTAHVPTSNADKYALGLRRQWPGRMDVSFRERRGIIHFDNAVATLTPRHDQLVVTILANDDPTMRQLQTIVARSLDGFALGEGALKFDWHPSSTLELRAL